MLKEYIAYIKDNPKRYWFKAKLYGWGWAPATWQGWCTMGVYFFLILGLTLIKEDSVPGNPDSGSNFLISGLPIIVLTILFVFVVYKKGEKPRWQWGLPKEKNDKSHSF